jgi:carboxymethylenebutenolidase
MGDFIKVAMADGALVETYQAVPNGARCGGIVLLQEIFGLTQHIQEQCDRFAAAGFEVLALLEKHASLLSDIGTPQA